MGLYIYVWLPTDECFGHSSMTLSDGTHISWWPGVDKNSKNGRAYWKAVEPHTPINYAADKKLEGNRAADNTFYIPSNRLDEISIKKWWTQFAAESQYHTIGNNCCSAVYEALNKGGATKYATFPLTPISKPENMNEYAEKLVKAMLAPYCST